MASPQLEEDRQSGIHPPVREAGPPPPRAEGSLLWRVGGVVKTVRPHQWVKNVFVLAPVVFAKEIFDPVLLVRAGGAFLVFCLLAGAVYTMNDIADVESDREHPVKRYRPIASGRVPMGFARGLVVALVAVSLVGASASSFKYMAVAGAYFILNVAYSSKLKHVAYLDVGCISAGFVLRVVGGGFATHISVSSYLLLCTALLALFLGFGKRRHEISLLAEGAGAHRASLAQYNLPLLDQIMGMVTTSVLVAYTLYTFEAETAIAGPGKMMLTVPFVFYFLARYLYLIHVKKLGGAPDELLLKDKPLFVNTVLWMLAVVVLIYVQWPG